MHTSDDNITINNIEMYHDEKYYQLIVCFDHDKHSFITKIDSGAICQIVGFSCANRVRCGTVSVGVSINGQQIFRPSVLSFDRENRLHLKTQQSDGPSAKHWKFIFSRNISDQLWNEFIATFKLCGTQLERIA